MFCLAGTAVVQIGYSIVQHRYSKCEIKENEIVLELLFSSSKSKSLVPRPICTRFKKNKCLEKCKTHFFGGNQHISKLFLRNAMIPT
jgi:hypothetical protein